MDDRFRCMLTNYWESWKNIGFANPPSDVTILSAYMCTNTNVLTAAHRRAVNHGHTKKMCLW